MAFLRDISFSEYDYDVCKNYLSQEGTKTEIPFSGKLNPQIISSCTYFMYDNNKQVGLGECLESVKTLELMA